MQLGLAKGIFLIVKSVFPLVAIISLRFLGLFIVLPVVSLYALNLDGSNKFLVGIMIGAYALTQLLLQVPFGILSDRIGRKITMYIGLFIFIIGSLVCGFAENIYILILGRFLQGSGAIGAVGTAMISDMAKEEVRGKAMAFMGASIAMSFALSMVLGPLIGGYFGTQWLFFLTAILSVIAMILLFLKVPNPPKISHDYHNNVGFFDIMKDPNLGKMNVTNFLQKGLMTLAFFVIPIIISHEFAWQKQELWKAYIPAMFFGLIAMAPSAILGEKKGKSKLMLAIGIVFFIIGYLLFGYAHSVTVFIIGIIVFFVGFNIHEPLMQSMASKYAKIHQKGASLGLFNAFGYAGTFTGGMVGGYLLHNHGLKEISWIVTIVCLGWLWIIYSLDNPANHKNIYLNRGEFDEENTKKLHDLKGIIEWYKRGETLVIKYNNTKVNEQEISALIKPNFA